MSNPMLSEKWESSSKTTRRELKRRERKTWKKPIRISKLPSFTSDQIPVIFSGYTAESEDSSSSDMSDDSISYSTKSSEVDQVEESSKSVRRMKSVKVLRRQSTRKGGGLMKMRSMKRVTSHSRHTLMKKKNLDLISREELGGLLEPHYLRPTSSSASKNVENVQKNLQAARLKRMTSLRYKGLLKATCSSAMKGSPSSKKSDDVCNYRYCSLHGRPHSHGGDDESGVVHVPSLKRFVSMRRKFVKRQKSVNRRLVLLKRSLSRKRGSADQESEQVADGDDNADGETGQEVIEEEVSSWENCGSDSESNRRSTETVMVDVDDNGDGGMDSVETLASAGRECVIQETIPEVMDDSDGRVDKDMKVKSEETVGDNEEVCRDGSSGELREEDGKKTGNIWNGEESKPEIMDDSDGRSDKYSKESNMTGLDYYNGEIEGTKSVEDDDDEDEKNTEDVWNDTVTLVKQAFDEILAEITDDDDSSDDALEGELANEYDDVADDSSAIEGRDTHLTVIVSTSHMEEGSDHNKRGAKKWSFLKRVILLKRFLKLLDRKERRKRTDAEENETIMRLRRELVGERKNAEEWMLDHALRQVIKTLAPPQRRKVKHLVKAFESLIPMNGSSRGHGGLGSSGREEKETVNSHTILRDTDDTTELPEVLSGKDLEETNLTREVKDLEEKKLTREVSSSLSLGMKSDEDVETIEDSSSSHQPAVEEVLDELASGSSIEEKEEKTGDSTIEEKEEKTGDSEKKTLSTWRNLIQKHMVSGDNEERKLDEAEKEDYRWSYGSNQVTGTEDHGDAAAATIKSFQQAFEMILSEIPDDEEIVSESSKEKEEDHGETKRRSWNSVRKVILLKRFVKSLEKVHVFNPRKLRNLPVVDSKLEEAENLLLRRHRSTIEEGIRTDGEEWMLDYAMRQALSRLAPVERKKVELLVQAFDTVLDGHDTLKQTKSTDTTVKERTKTVEEDSEVSKDEQRIKNVFSRFQVHQKDLKQEEEVDDTPKNNVEAGTDGTVRADKDEQKIANVFSKFQVHQKDLKGEEEVDSTPRRSSSLLPPIGNVKQRIVVEKEKDSRMWKLIYKHMVTEKEEETSSVDGECDDETANLQIDARRSGTVTLVREALEKILSEIPDNSSDDQSIDSATDQELMERNSQVSEESSMTSKRKKGWNNVKKVILLKRFVSDLGRLSPKTPRFLPWEPDPETEKIRLRHQEVGGKRNSEEWMLDYALRQAISTLPPSQRRKVSLLAQAFDTISFSSTPGSAATSRNISRQSSLSSMTVHNENEGNAEILRGKLRKLQEDLKETTKVDGDLDEKQECSSLWRLLCKQMEDNERNQTLPKEEQESEEDTSVDGEKMEDYKTEAVELLGEVIDGISLEESQKSGTSQASQVKINRWSSVKKAMQLRKFVKALENVRKFNPREPRFLPLEPGVEAERVNLRHQETRNKRNGDEWMVDNSLQEVVSKLTPARRDKVKLLVQAFESLSATGN
ncbi:calmodulin binding protein PICBP [Brassica napus]|uniref:calmodulin binding protein PICBP n=1 Tax=Brassica napus TaxID=3708 RepID=UPI0006AAAF69|nr:calmodulin binding protein PICBP [Brassica napus]